MKKPSKHISISVTGANVRFNNETLTTDANGNNAAFSCPCPKCKHPVLLVIGSVNNRGLFPKRPAECPHCHRKYVVSRLVVNRVEIAEATPE